MTASSLNGQWNSIRTNQRLLGDAVLFEIVMPFDQMPFLAVGVCEENFNLWDNHFGDSGGWAFTHALTRSHRRSDGSYVFLPNLSKVKKLSCGDIIGIQIDRNEQTISFYCNYALVVTDHWDDMCPEMRLYPCVSLSGEDMNVTLNMCPKIENYTKNVVKK
jgi:hypothetical protein